jgi:hypothetical protein
MSNSRYVYTPGQIPSQKTTMPPDHELQDLRADVDACFLSLFSIYKENFLGKTPNSIFVRLLEASAELLKNECTALADRVEYEERKEAAHQQSMSDLEASGGIVDAP